MPVSLTPASKTTPPRPRKLRWIRALAAAIVGGGAAAAVAYLPGVTVTPVGPLDPANPYPASFTIADANFVPLNGVNVYLLICYVNPDPVALAQRCQLPYGTRYFKAGWTNQSLSGGQQITITLDDFMRSAAPTKLGGADITIIVEYQPWILPTRQEKEFRFVAVAELDGKLHWVPRPLEQAQFGR